MLETESSYLFSSEPGIIPTTEYMNDPKPLAPGEKVGFKWKDDVLDVYYLSEYQAEVLNRFPVVSTLRMHANEFCLQSLIKQFLLTILAKLTMDSTQLLAGKEIIFN